MLPNDGRKAEITCWGLEKGCGRLKEQKSISRTAVKKAVRKMKTGKDPGVDGIRAEVLKYGGDIIVNILV